MSNYKQILKFLAGLERLTRETGVIIGGTGCGCCGVTFLRVDRALAAKPDHAYRVDDIDFRMDWSDKEDGYEMWNAPSPEIKASLKLSEPDPEIATLIRLLRHAVTEADGWHDECREGPITGDPLIDEARRYIDE